MNRDARQPPSLQDLQESLIERLQIFGRRVRLHLFAEGLARVAAGALALALLTYILDRTLRLGLTARLVMLGMGTLLLLAEMWRSVIRPARLKFGPLDLAALLDRRMPDAALAPAVASILQLPQLAARQPHASEAMVRLAVEQAHTRLAGERFVDRLDSGRFVIIAMAIAMLFLTSAALALAWPAEASLWARRWFAASNQPWPQQTYLRIVGLQDGKLLAPRGEASVLRVISTPTSIEPPTITLELRHGGTTRSGVMSRFAARDWRYDLPPLQTPATVAIEGNDESIGPVNIEPIDRPRIVAIELRSRHPSQSHESIRNFSGQEADLAYLPETSLELRFAANVAIAQALVKNSGPLPDGDQVRRIDDRTFALAWIHRSPARLQIELIGAVGGLTSAPLPLAIDLKTDAAPRVNIQFNGVRSRVTPSARIPLNVQARDDYGIAMVQLLVRPERLTDSATQPASPARQIPLMDRAAPAAALEIQRKYVLNLSEEQLVPGTAVVVAANAVDERWGGPQTGQSRNLTFRVVAAEELFREILLRQQAERAKFRKLIDDAQKLHDDLATAADPAAIGLLARQHRLHQRETARLSTALAESLLEMQLNALGGQEAYDLMDNKIIRPLRELADGAMTQQRDALDVLSRAQDAGRLAEVAPRQEQIVGQMREILRQMSQWDSFVDVLNQLNEVIKMQERVKGSTEQIRKGQEESIFEK